jgi:multicomponent Na+:H+ antiporter subunit C
MTILLAFVTAVLFGCGTFLLLQRRLSRIIIGIGLLGHGANLLLMASGGPPGPAPIVGEGADPDRYADPLPQALALTAIVITFGVTAFLLSMAYRSWQLSHDDAVRDDLEDRLVAHRRRDADLEDAAHADLEHAADSADEDDTAMADRDPRGSG